MTGRSLSVGVLLVLACTPIARSSRHPVPLPWPRAGVVVVQEVHAEVLDLLGPVWYYGYGFQGADLRGHQRVYMVRASPRVDEERLVQALRTHPGRWWLIGNEPNDPNQDALSPGAFAGFYHRVYVLAKRADPTCHLAPAGLANADWRWAESFRESYRQQQGRYPRVDAWSIHNYILEPHCDQLDVAEFKTRILDFREWLTRIGERDTPLFLTEFGALYPPRSKDGVITDEGQVRLYIHDVVDWLSSTEHVQAWAWFANDTKGVFHGDLYDSSNSLTNFGEAYRDAIMSNTHLAGESTSRD